MYVLAHDQSVCTDRNRDTLLMYESTDFSVIESVLVVLRASSSPLHNLLQNRVGNRV